MKNLNTKSQLRHIDGDDRLHGTIDDDTPKTRSSVWRKIFSWHGLSIAIVALILLSMLSWGIGDIFSKKSSEHIVAKVGDKVISRKDFEKAVNRFKNVLSQAQKDSILPEEEIENAVLREEINRIILSKEMEQMDFVISNQDMADYILKMNETLVDENGQLNIRLIRGILRANNMSEQEFFDSIKLDIFVKKILGIIESGAVSPVGIAEKIALSRKEKRFFDLLILSKSTSNKISVSEEEINNFYNKNTKKFMQPAFQKIAYLSGDDIIKQSKISADPKQIADRYEKLYQQGNQIFTIAILIFDTQKQAQDLKDSLKSTFNNSLVKAAASVGKSKSDVILEKVQLGQFKPEMRHAIVNMKINQISDVIKIEDKFAIVQILKIGKNKQFYDKAEIVKIKQDIARTVTTENTCAKLQAVRTQIDNAIKNKIPLDIIAKNLGLVLHKEKIDEDHMLFDQSNQIGNISFSPKPQQYCSFFVVRLDDSAPKKPRPVNEVYQLVKNATHEHKADLMARTTANSVAEQLKTMGPNEKNIRAITSGRNFIVKSGLSLTREEIEKPILKDMGHALFTLKVGEISGPFIDKEGKYGEKGSYLLIVLRSISADKTDNKTLNADSKTIHENLLKQKRNDILTLYMGHLYKKYKVKRLI